MAESDLLYCDLTREIIGAAMEMHKTLGCGFLESVYEEALAIEFNLRKVRHERQKGIDVIYKGLLTNSSCVIFWWEKKYWSSLRR